MTRNRMGGPGLGLAVCFLAISACAHPPPGATPGAVADPCGAPGADSTGWVEVDAGPFRFSAPPEYRRRTVRGIDSYVGRWSASRRRSVDFDWGMYSWPMDDAAARLQDYRECTTQIGGHPVKVVSGYDATGRMGEGGRKYVVAAAWRDVVPGTHLTLTASAADASDLPALRGIVRSIRFDPQQ